MPVALSAHRPAARTPAWPAGRRCSPISGSGTAADSRVVTPPRVRAEAGARRRTDFSSLDRPGACPNATSPVLPGLGSWGFSLEGRRPRLGRHGGRTARRTRNRLRGYSADRTMIAAWTCGSRGPATTTRGRPGSSNPLSLPTPTAWTTWSGCAGRTASCALAATTPVGGWAVGDGRYKCAGCGARTSVTAGTLFDRRRTPLTVWFTACWMFASQKDGVSALSLQRTLEIGSYATAWAMLHRLRSVLVRPGRDRLTGRVEVDETFIGGEEPGLSGGRAKGKKSLVAVAVEVHEPRGYGRVRMGIIADASAACLHPFITANVEPGGTVITDGWQGYSGIK